MLQNRCNVLICIWLWLVCAAPLTWCSGCSQECARTTWILAGPDGTEHGFPSYRLFRRLLDARGEQRAVLLGSTIEVLQGGGAYSRLVAARALLEFFEYCPEELTEVAAKAVAVNCIILAQEPRWRRMSGPYIMSSSLIDDDKGMAYPISPQTVMRVDGLNIILGDGLPKAWMLEKGAVFLDGEVLTGRDEYPETRFGNKPREFLLPKYYLERGRMYGRHKLVSKATLVAPNGTKIHMERAIDFEVMTEEQERKLLEKSIE